MSQHYLLPCSCGKKTTVSVGQAGSKVKCECGKTLDVPVMRNLRSLQPATTSAKKESEAELTANAMTSARIFFSLSLFIAFAGFGVASLLYVQRSKLDLGIPQFEINKIEAETIEKLSPLEAYKVWNQFEKIGLKAADTSPWKAAQLEFLELTQRMKVAIMVAGLGMVSAATSAMLGRNRTK